MKITYNDISVKDEDILKEAQEISDKMFNNLKISKYKGNKNFFKKYLKENPVKLKTSCFFNINDIIIIYYQKRIYISLQDLTFTFNEANKIKNMLDCFDKYYTKSNPSIGDYMSSNPKEEKKKVKIDFDNSIKEVKQIFKKYNYNLEWF